MISATLHFNLNQQHILYLKVETQFQHVPSIGEEISYQIHDGKRKCRIEDVIYQIRQLSNMPNPVAVHVDLIATHCEDET